MERGRNWEARVRELARRGRRALVLGAALASSAAAPCQAGASVDDAFRAGLADTGAHHTCAVGRDGGLACWGDDEYGQLGGDAMLPGRPDLVRVALPSGRTALAVSAGVVHTCAILDDGSLWCWGLDGGQLGDDAVGHERQPTPVRVALPPGRAVVAVAAGDGTTCAILDDGDAACWGDDTDGQLGDGGRLGPQPIPVRVALPRARRAVSIDVGESAACAALDDGSLRCWGSGPAVPGGIRFTPVPVPLPAGAPAVRVGVGAAHACALRADGSVWCWGGDFEGQLGNDDARVDQSAPVAVALPAGRRAAALSVGANHGCAILDDRTLACWGSDGNGRLGDGPSVERRAVPVSVGMPPGRSLAAVSAGWYTTCATLDDGQLRCWGLDASGQLGNGIGAGDIAVAGAVIPALPPGALAARAGRATVSLRLSPTRDVTAPYETTASGRIRGADVSPRLGCRGRVRLSGRLGTRAVGLRPAPLRLVDGACVFTARVSLGDPLRGSARSLAIRARFPGNDALRAAVSGAAVLRLAAAG